MIVSAFFSSLEEIKVLLASSIPLRAKWMAIRPRLGDPDVAREFWMALAGVEWLEFGKRDQFFADPPQLEGRGAANWPQSKYLNRVAAEAPSEAAAIFAEIETDNPSIHRDMIEAALKMPPAISATLVSKIAAVMAGRSQWLNFKDASELCAKLAEGGQSEMALQLARTLFEPSIENESGRLDQNQYWYMEGIKLVAPKLVAARPEEFLGDLCRFLEIAILARKPSVFDGGWDYSYAWRPAVEEHVENVDMSLGSQLVGVLRQAFEQAVRANGITLQDACRLLENKPFAIFKRIKLFLLNVFPEMNNHLVRENLMNFEYFQSHWYEHEYAALLEGQFAILLPEERATWFGWVKAGPDLSSTPLERQQIRKRYWQFERWHWVRSYLTGPLEDQYAKMLQEFGEPGSPGMMMRFRGGFRGGESPYTAAELAKKSFREVVDLVDSWRPPSLDRGVDSPSFEGLGLQFGEYLAAKSAEVSMHADLLEGRSSYFVQIFIDRMASAVRDGKEVYVEKALALCDWISKQPVESEKAIVDLDGGIIDQGWRGARDSVSRFIEEVCTAETNGFLRFGLVEIEGLMVEILARLSHDTSKSNILVKEELDPEQTDYLLYAINSPRGRALAALLKCVRWIALQRQVDEDGRKVVPNGFGSMPRVREVLEWQLEAENRSCEAFSVMGTSFGLLNWIDKAWLRDHIPTIFRLDPAAGDTMSHFGWAAWNSFLMWDHPHIDFYELLKAQFSYAVDRARDVRPVKKGGEQPVFRLGVQLLILCGRGQLTLDQDNGVLRRFLTNAHPEVRAYAFQFIGRSIHREPEVPKKIIQQFMEIWEWYWATVAGGEVDAKRDSGTFGSWFASGKFPPEWSIKQLLSFVLKVGIPKPDHGVMEELGKIAAVDVETAVEILDIAERADASGTNWYIFTWIDSVMKILRLGLKAGTKTRTTSVEMIDRLGRRGFLKFGELLKE